MNEKEIQLAHAMLNAEAEGGNFKALKHMSHTTILQEKIEKGMR